MSRHIQSAQDEYVKHDSLWIAPPDEYGIRAHRASIQKWALHDLVYHLPKVQFSPEALPRNFWPPKLADFSQSEAHVRYACAELTRHGVLWAKSFAMLDTGSTLHTAPRTFPQLAAEISNSLWLRLEVDDPDAAVLEHDGVHAFVFPHFSPQWEFMRSFAYRATQANWMFHDSLRSREARRTGTKDRFRELRAAITSTLGMTVPEFVGCVQMLFARSLSDSTTIDSGRLYLSPEIIDEICPWSIGANSDRMLYTARIARAFALLSASQVEMQALLKEQAGTNSELAMLKGPGPLQQKPILLPFSNSRGFGIAPVPHLLMEFLYEPLTDLLYSAARKAKVVSEFNQLFEEYVGLLLQRHSPGTIRWLYEDDLKPNTQRVVDWAAIFPSHVVLVDAKRAWIDPACRHRLHDGDWWSFHQSLLEGVRQGGTFWRDVIAGRVPALRAAKNKRPLLVLATSSDNRVLPYPKRLREQLLEAAHQEFPGLNVSVVWLDQLHSLLNTWQARDVEWLPEVLSRSRRLDAQYLQSRLLQGVSGPMWRAFTEPLKNVASDD